MSTAREMVRIGLVLDGLGQPVDLNAVDWHVRQQNPAASPSDIQEETLEVIRSLVNDGLFHLGELSRDGRFVPWDRPLDQSLHKLSHVYVKHYEDPEKWMYYAWLELTDTGERLARTIERKDIQSYRSR
ncbi:hypothetical protein [Mycobacterium talmoniae]|uniref:hypothetical protein n=1 Tax=Mycobacterium talmoniae TaxID=1858794 RepID=UPI001F60994F|nr:MULTISPECIES: hypothetical protein [Mycobacterium]